MPIGISLKNVTTGTHKYRAFDKMDNDTVVFDGSVTPGEKSTPFDLAPDVDNRGSVSVTVSGMVGKTFSSVSDGDVLDMD